MPQGTSLLQHHTQVAKRDLAVRLSGRRSRRAGEGLPSTVPAYDEAVAGILAELDPIQRGLRPGQRSAAQRVLSQLPALDLSALAGGLRGFHALTDGVLSRVVREEMDPDVAADAIELLRPAQIKAQFAERAVRLAEGSAPAPELLTADNLVGGILLGRAPGHNTTVAEILVEDAAITGRSPNPTAAYDTVKAMWADQQPLTLNKGVDYARRMLQATSDPYARAFDLDHFTRTPGAVRAPGALAGATPEGIRLGQLGLVGQLGGSTAADFIEGTKKR